MKKILITSSDAMMYQFLLKHALNLISKGYQVDVACFAAESYESCDYLNRIRQALPSESRFFEIGSTRSPFSLSNVKGYKQLKAIIDAGDYDIVWTNEPVMSVITRLAARRSRKHSVRVLYMSHGFHFYDGAPLVNWLLFYPIEKLMLRFTDMLVTINRDDYRLASDKFKRCRIHYIQGIGFDTERFASAESDKAAIRNEVGIPQDAFLILSVGELNENKNHIAAIKAFAQLPYKDAYYLICGSGPLDKTLRDLSVELGVAERVILAGFREDIADLCHCADLYCFPSLREGLSVSLMEAMSCKLPVVCSDIRGNRDLIIDGNGGYLCDANDSKAYADAIEKLYRDRELRAVFGNRNADYVKSYSSAEAKASIEKIISMAEKL